MVTGGAAEPSVAVLVIRKRLSTGEMSYTIVDSPRGGATQSNSLVTAPSLRLGDTVTEAAIMAPLRST